MQRTAVALLLFLLSGILTPPARSQASLSLPSHPTAPAPRPPAALSTTSSAPLTILGRDMLAQALDQQHANWVRYTGADSPEGAYMGWLFAGTSSLTGTLTLPSTLPAGRYHVFIKGINYDKAIRIAVAVGGGQTTLLTDDRDENGYWSVAGTVDVTTASNTLTLTLLTPNATIDTKYLLRGVYITSNLAEFVNRFDTVLDLTYPTGADMDTRPPVAGNLLANSSFETGIGYGWALSINRQVSLDQLWDTTVAYHGQASVRIPLDASARSYHNQLSLTSRVYHVKPNKQYTFSAWVKAPPGQTVYVRLRMVNTFEPPPGAPAQPSLATDGIAVRDTWQRVSLTGYLLKYPTSDYILAFDVWDSPGNYLWVDAVQLEEGSTPTTYTPRRPLEVGLTTDKPGHIFYADEPVTMRLRAVNSAAADSVARVSYQVYNHLNALVKSGSLDLPVPANTTRDTPLDLGTGKQGAFRVTLRLEGESGPQEETVFSVVPRPQTNGADATSLIGTHPDFNALTLTSLQALGVKWARASSPAAYFRWADIEPQDNQFVWYDAEVQRAVSSGLTVLGTLGSNTYWPAWADRGGYPDLDKWEEFVGQVVTHYKGQVHYWEIWNEPNRGDPLQGHYAEMLFRATRAIERSDPNAQVVAMGGASLPYIKSVIAEMERRSAEWGNWIWQQHIHIISTHAYPAGAGQELAGTGFKTDIIDRYGVQVWNTEAGVKDWTFYQGANSDFVTWGVNLWPHTDALRYYEAAVARPEQIAINFLHSIGEGFTKYFYYDSRLYASPDYLRSHFTSIEYDDTIRPKGVVYAALARLFDHAVGLGQLRLTDPNSLGYLYDRQGVALAAVYTLDQTNKTLNLGGRLSPSQFKVYDMLGNPLTVAPTSIPLGRRPIYIEGQGITPAALRTALEGGAMSNQADSQPPNLTLSDIQVTGASDASLRVRWLALDDTALPSDSQPDALLYSYHLVGLAGQDTWTPWTPSTYVDYTSVPAGSYVFEVKAKDAAGNVSPVASEVLRVGAVCVVDITAITPVAARWAGRQGQSGYDAQYDFDHNGVIDILDVMQVAARWGRPC